MESNTHRKKREQFERLLMELEDKHKEYFAQRINENGKRPGKISDHFIFANENNEFIKLIWLKDSTLRRDIIDEATHAYRQVFQF